MKPVTYLGEISVPFVTSQMEHTLPEKWSNQGKKGGLASFSCQFTKKRDNFGKVDFD